MSCRRVAFVTMAVVLLAAMAFTAAPSDATAVRSMECNEVTFVLFSDDIRMSTAEGYPVSMHVYNAKTTAVTVKILDANDSAINLSVFPNEYVVEGKNSVQVEGELKTDRYTSMGNYNITLVMQVMDGTTETQECRMDIPVSVVSNYSSGESYNRFFGIFDNQLPEPFNTAPVTAILTLLMWIGISVLVGIVAMFILKSVFKVIEKDSETLGRNTTIGITFCILLQGITNCAFIVGADEMIVDNLMKITGILYIMLVALIVWDIYKAVITGALNRLEKKGSNVDTSLIPLFKAIGQVVIILVSIALILSEFGVNFLTLIASAGLTGLGLSFGVKPAINELFSGLIVLLTRPFKVGDYVTIGNDSRLQVAEIGILRTNFKTGYTREVAYMPNSKIASSKIVNISHRTLMYRNTISIKVPFDSNLTLIRKLVKRVASDHPNVVTDGSVPKPNAVFSACEDRSGIIMTLAFYVYDFDVNATTTAQIREGILKAFKERDIIIPYNKMEISVYRGGQYDAQ